MITFSLANEVPCEKICQKIQKEVLAWVKNNGNRLEDCVLTISIREISHTVENPDNKKIIAIGAENG